MRICGTVKSGRGKASKLIVDDKLEARRDAMFMHVVPGTLNVDVGKHADDFIDQLGEPELVVEEPWSVTGDLRCWRVKMRVGAISSYGWIVRGVASTAPALETMAAVHWRSFGIKDGDPVVLER